VTYALGAIFSRVFEVRDPDLTICDTTFMALLLRQMGLFAKSVWPCAKEHTYSSLRMRKITSALNAAVNLLPPSFSTTGISR